MVSVGRWGATIRKLALVCALLVPVPALALETTLTAPGAPEDLTETLTLASSIMSAQDRGLDTVQELLAAAQADYRTIVQVLYDRGFFSPVVNIRVDGREAASIDMLSPPRSVNKVEITVQTGRAFTFSRANMAPLAPETELPTEFRAGGAASTAVLEDAASAGITGWRQAGYAKAKLADQRILVRHSDATMDADLTLLPGPKLTFGKMSIKGDTDVRPEALQKIAGFPTGEVFDPDKVQKVGTRLRRTGTFSSVSIVEAEQPNPDGSLDFEAEFTDNLKRRLELGVELSSRTGLDLTANWTHRNLLKGADRLRFEARIRNLGGTEDIDGRIALRLDQPAKLGPDDSVFYNAELEKLNRPHYKVLRGHLGIGVRRTFSDRLYAEASVGGLTSRADDAFGTDRRFYYAVVPLRVEWDQRDVPVSATRGFYLDTRVTPAVGVKGTKPVLHVMLDGRGYFSLTDRIVLAGRAQIGSAIGASLPEVSPDLLFFSGGAGTVRGQPYQSLGIPIAGRVAGGRSILALSAEIRGHVTEKLSLVGFYDFGAVDASSFVSSSSIYHSGAGLGVRYDVGGFGPLRVDLALPVDGPTDDGLQFYIGIGQAF